ncbi:hypothetical protein FR932_09925 [Moritella marina ATCC 15381]|uniref:Site-specific integrase n=1 Tax=Moritella marina ATCC 15381 TaxID=1202962 RepID=A0A5J6WLL0_MORMI|nr:hypothetical protein [Moritella marina]QFI38138.1 hypothetical protein FR932_09925 [Moritella marina ATCC 15381]
MNKKQFANLKHIYKGQREFTSKEDGYTFDFLCDSWELGYKKSLYLEWMHKVDLDEFTFLDLRLAIAHAAKSSAHGSMVAHCYYLKSIAEHLDLSAFEAWWLTLNNIKKKGVKSALTAIFTRYASKTLKPLYDAIKDFSTEIISMRGGAILDSKKGSYSQIEQDNIQEALRIETSECLSQPVKASQQFTRFRNVIASQLITAITRRPTQLRQIKWCDTLPVGTTFTSPKETNGNWEPLTQHMFSDVEQLHIRTFKGKDGRFRYNAEPRSHRLEPNFSHLILRYFQAYQEFLIHQLNEKGVYLNKDEINEIMMCLPLLPDQTLFSSNFTSKKELFNAVSITSEAYHSSATSIRNSIKYLFKKLNPASDRHPMEGVMLSNNRWRHTQLTQAAKLGFSPAQISNITGVTINAIQPYLDLKVQVRVKVDEAYAGNHIIKLFDSISVAELQKKAGFSVKNEFDEEMGYKLTPANCSSCESKGGAPMACYPCNNFRPLETANHQQYLDKALHKLKKNAQSGHPATTKMLKKIIIYIKATIAECNERAILKLGGK